MFTITEIRSGNSTVQVREEHVSGLRCRISPERLNRRIDSAYVVPPIPDQCPFCEGEVERVTPTFPDGTRIPVGESLTFPNLFPFAEWHTVTVISRAHHVGEFSRRQVEDALVGQTLSLRGRDGTRASTGTTCPRQGRASRTPTSRGSSTGGLRSLPNGT